MSKKGFRIGVCASGLVCLFFLCGCETTKPLYHWGSYETLTYAQFAKAERLSPGEQLIHLEEDLQKARSKNLSPPPGMCAYMGYLYLENGEPAKGHSFFEKEKELFPESEAFMDLVLQKISPEASESI